MRYNEIIVKVSFPAWGVSNKSWYLLTKRSSNKTSWSGGVWIPKSVCTLEESRHEKGVGILTLPLWLFNKKSEEGIEFTNLQDVII